jgi:hypothetical protein
MAPVKVKRPHRLSTQLLLFEAVEDHRLDSPYVFRVSSATGLTPGLAKAALEEAGVYMSGLRGLSVETNVEMTIGRHRAADGTGIVVMASILGEGCKLRVQEVGKADDAVRLSTLVLAQGESAAFAVRLGGRPMIAVVHSARFDDQTLDSIVHDFHVPFTEAVAAYPGWRSGDFKYDRPRVDSAIGRPLFASAIADKALSAARRRVYE